MEDISPATVLTWSSSFLKLKKLLVLVLFLLAIYIFFKLIRSISTYIFKLVLLNSLNLSSFSNISDIRCKSLKFSLKKRKITLKSCHFLFFNHNFSIKKIQVHFSKNDTEGDENDQSCSKILFNAKIKIFDLFIQNFCSNGIETEKNLYLNEILKFLFDFLKDNHISKNDNGQVQLKIPQNFSSNKSENGNFIFQLSEIVIQSFSYENIFCNQNSSEDEANETMNSILILFDKMKVLKNNDDEKKLFYYKIKKIKIRSKGDSIEKLSQTQKFPLIFFSDFLNFDTNLLRQDATNISVNLNVGPSFFPKESKLIPQIVGEIENFFSIKIPIMPEYHTSSAYLASKNGNKASKRSPEIGRAHV